MPTSTRPTTMINEQEAIPAIAPYPMPLPNQIPANRVDWTPEPNRCALLVHDMQLFFLNKYNQQEAPIPTLIDHTQKLLTLARKLQIPVFYTAQPSQQSASERGLLNDMWGDGINRFPEQATICEQLTPQGNDHRVEKWRYSAFRRSDFQQQLMQRGRDQLLITGIFAHIGCMTTALDAFMLDIQPFFVADALADFSRAEHDMALTHVANRCGVCLSTEQVISAFSRQHEINDTSPAGVDKNSASIIQLDRMVAELLGHPINDISINDDLTWMGMDSIRLMMLLDQLTQSGYRITFADLAENPTLAQWRRLITEQESSIQV